MSLTDLRLLAEPDDELLDSAGAFSECTPVPSSVLRGCLPSTLML